jgi:hypothetical protein
LNSLSKLVQAFYGVATLHTLQGGQPIFDGAHYSERNLIVRKPLKALQVAEKQLPSLIALFVLCEPVVAQTSDCQSIQKASDRLACYDRASPPLSKPSTEHKPVTQQA